MYTWIFDSNFPFVEIIHFTNKLIIMNKSKFTVFLLLFLLTSTLSACWWTRLDWTGGKWSEWCASLSAWWWSYNCADASISICPEPRMIVNKFQWPFEPLRCESGRVEPSSTHTVSQFQSQLPCSIQISICSMFLGPHLSRATSIQWLLLVAANKKALQIIMLQKSSIKRVTGPNGADQIIIIYQMGSSA